MTNTIGPIVLMNEEKNATFYKISGALLTNVYLVICLCTLLKLKGYGSDCIIPNKYYSSTPGRCNESLYDT